MVWKNSNSTVSLNGGTVSPITGINLADYDEYEIYAKNNFNSKSMVTCKIADVCSKGTLFLCAIGSSSSNINFIERSVTIGKSNNLIEFSDCYVTNTSQVNNDFLIPFAIYGIKY